MRWLKLPGDADPEALYARGAVTLTACGWRQWTDTERRQIMRILGGPTQVVSTRFPLQFTVMMFSGTPIGLLLERINRAAEELGFIDGEAAETGDT